MPLRAQSNEKGTPIVIKKTVLSLCMAAALAFTAACGNDDGSESSSAKDKESSSAQEKKEQKDAEGAQQEPQPDLEDVPEVVAEVNGDEITKDEFTDAYERQFQQAAMQSQASGQEVDQDALKKDVANSLVGLELLLQEAEDRGYKASEKDVDSTLDDLAKQNGMKSGDQVITALKEQGMAEDEVRAQITDQVKIEQLLAAEAGAAEPTEAEMKALYKQLSSQQGAGAQGGLPPYEKVKPQLRQQVKSQKEGQVAEALIADLRKQGDVTINL